MELKEAAESKKRKKDGKKTGAVRRFFVRFFRAVLLILLLAVLGIVGVNAYVIGTQRSRILKVSDLEGLEDADCILVLGCGVQPDKTPSPMLKDRLDRSLEVYRTGVSEKFLMSGDHGDRYYDEVGTMRRYVIGEGVSTTDIFMDHAGFSTYESMYRAKEVFGVERVVIVTQEYHLYRALYIANALGIEAYGVSSDYRLYAGQLYREAREVAARIKDFIACFYWPAPTYLGDPIDIHGDGNVTVD